MRLPGPILRTLCTLGRGLSETRARLHFPRVEPRRRTLIVAGIMVCGALVLLTVGVFGVLKAQRDGDGNLPTGDLGALTTPAGYDKGTRTATLTPAGHDKGTPAATSTPARHDKRKPAATTTPLPDVAPPVRMVIEKMGVDAPIITLGADANLRPQVPDGPDVVAWYDFSAKPGQGSNAVFAGHVDWTVNGQPVTGVFWGLGELEEDDVVKIVLEDGSELQYRVTHSIALGHDDPEGVEVMYGTPNDVITLISCGGTWVADRSNPLGGNYTHRVVVRAERVT